ncbi:hypothetical protein CHARACLAT_032248 [Characodon lateralis]|uniref:Uncharacterized protein n=1 Tax=Characodon lateralis TaxID=208331 RepID=A0ABU7EYX3_9TELE|nr:hypothetical protein [Characodon lateralis]
MMLWSLGPSNVCSVRNACRKNVPEPIGKCKTFTVFISAGRSARSRAKNTPDEGDSHDKDDSFINDDSDDLGNDSDYVPPGPDDSEQEDVQRLQKEATAYLKKGRR